MEQSTVEMKELERQMMLARANMRADQEKLEQTLLTIIKTKQENTDEFLQLTEQYHELGL